jgi:hypothetical protein
MSNVADQTTLFPMPEVEKPFLASVEERVEQLGVIGKAVGGLLPRNVASEVLGVSIPRISQLIDANQLEEIKYFGVSFVSGRSIKEWGSCEKSVGGRGKRRSLGLWKSVVVGVKVGKALGDAYTNDL